MKSMIKKFFFRVRNRQGNILSSERIRPRLLAKEGRDQIFRSRYPKPKTAGSEIEAIVSGSSRGDGFGEERKSPGKRDLWERTVRKGQGIDRLRRLEKGGREAPYSPAPVRTAYTIRPSTKH